MKKNVLLLAVVLLLLIRTGSMTAEDETPEVLIAISPAPVPKAALENPLLPPLSVTTRGNAALVYLRAATMSGDLKAELAAFRDRIPEFLQSPLDELPVDDARKAVAEFEHALNELRIGSRRQRCEWQLPVEESGTQLYYLLLPEMQALRDLARVLAVRIRLQIHDGRLEDAIESLQTGYAMGRHIADAPFLINALVGVSVCQMMNERVLELSGHPESPNLYWSLTALPRPMINLRRALEFEASSAMIVFPELANADTVTGEASRREFESFLQRYDELAGDSSGTSGPEYELRQRLEATITDEAQMRKVRRFLTSDAGYSNAAVDAMVPTQAVMIRERILYERLRDAMFIHSFLPYSQALAGFEAWQKSYMQLKDNSEGLPLIALLLPGMDRACEVQARLDRGVAALRIIESIRASISGHELPESLQSLSLPAPHNPIDDNPFDYNSTQREATLTTDDETGRSIRYRIRLRK